MLPGKATNPGRTGSDNRLFVNGCLWVLRSGAPLGGLLTTVPSETDHPSPDG